MSAYNFGVGTIGARRTDTANATPIIFGTLQDISIDFDQALKELRGQYKMAVDVAPAELKVTGKAKFARIQANTMNDLLFGQTVTTASGAAMVIAENHVVAATTQAVTNAGTFLQDRGVFYRATGVQLQRVAPAAEATGKYSVNEATGTYTFAVGDEVSLDFYYTMTVSNLKQISMANQLMGAGPSFELNAQESYTNNSGVANAMYIKLNACRSSKLSLPFKNGDYTIQEFDFTAFADQSNNWGMIATTE